MCRRRSSVAAILTASLLTILALHPDMAAIRNPSWEQLQKEGAVIASIRIEVENVFPKNEHASRYWFARAADVIHIKTKKRIVERELLFKVGDKVDAARILDSERALRETLDIARDAVIVPERVEGRKVWVLVLFKDAWTLGVDVNYGHVGGQNKYKFRIHERNFLGLGKGVLISHERTFERSINMLAYYDPQLFGSRWTLNANYRQLSDGKSRLFEVGRPFYTLQTPWSFQLRATDFDETLTLYNLAHSVYAMRNQDRSVTLTSAWAYHETPDGVFRVGAGFVVRQMTYYGLVTYRPGYLPPLALQDHRLRGPEVTWEWFQDRFRDFRDMQTIGRTEQYNLGWDVNASAGYYTGSLGSAANGPFFLATAAKGWLFGDDTLLLENGTLQGRRENGLWRNAFLTNEVTVYNQSLPEQTLAGDFRLDLGSRPDPEAWLYLGGQDGLRGYPNHFLAGDKRWVTSLEDRIVTSHTILGLLQVGYVGFVDAGAIHAFGAGGWGKTYSDVGFGLRFGNIRSRASSVLELTVAVPLVKGPGSKGYEIVAGDVLRF